MTELAAFSSLTGLYVLTAEGLLGCLDAEHRLHIDHDLSRAFSAHNTTFLTACAHAAERARYRLAIIYRGRRARPWGLDTLRLEDAVVRDLYPVGGVANETLTSFQSKNQEKSVYRGMELLLEYQTQATPGAAMFCPVLLDHKFTLAQRPELPPAHTDEADPGAPTLELLNLVAPIAAAKRAAPAIIALRDRIYTGTVRKNERQTARLTLMESVDLPHDTGKLDDAYASQREQALDSLLPTTPYGILEPNSPAAISLAESGLIQRLARWIEQPPEPPSPELLKNFVTFADLSDQRRTWIAERSMVFRVPAGAPLLERGKNDNWNLYLAEGTVELTAADGAHRLIESGTANARNPIAFLRPRMFAVSAHTRVAFVWIHDQVVAEALSR